MAERMHMGDGGVALYDNGFYNIGVTRTENDIGVGGTDSFGNPLSFARQYTGFLAGNQNALKDRFRVDPCSFEIPFKPADCTQPPPANDRVAVGGAVKTPSLRNVELTGPFMHSGSMATLEQVVDGYNRGMNFRNNELDPNIEPLGLTVDEKAGLVAFLKTLTDPRVRFEKAPFDHPELRVPNGHPVDENVATPRAFNLTLAKDDFRRIPASGRGGRQAPLKRFDQCLAPNVNVCPLE